jgi:hypothetical protein
MRHPRREKGPSDSVRLFAQMFDFLSTQRTEKLLATKLDIGMVRGCLNTWRVATASALLQRAAPATVCLTPPRVTHALLRRPQGLPFNAIAGSSSHLPAQYGVQVSNGQDECDGLIAGSACSAHSRACGPRLTR